MTTSEKHEHCVKSVQIRRLNLRIQSECRKIRTRKNAAFRHFSSSGKLIDSEYLKYFFKNKECFRARVAALMKFPIKDLFCKFGHIY